MKRWRGKAKAKPASDTKDGATASENKNLSFNETEVGRLRAKLEKERQGRLAAEQALEKTEETLENTEEALEKTEETLEKTEKKLEKTAEALKQQNKPVED